MFCVKVNPGSERIQVRHYTSGFLPSYKAADPDGKSRRKLLVVPGYIFMLQKASRAEKVPEAEWAVIDALSDPHPSVLDRETGTITDGPLTAVQDYITGTTDTTVQIRVSLLGESRLYRLPVAPPEGEAGDAPAEDAEKTGEEGNQERNIGPSVEETDADKKGKSAYTEEQKAEMIARAGEIGVRAAAEEYGVPWQTIAQFKRRAKEADRRTAETAEIAEPASFLPAGIAEEAPEDAEGLQVENAVLRERIEQLEEKIISLKKALDRLV